MTEKILQELSDSAKDFQNIVWPHISRAPLVGGGELHLVEAVAEKTFQKNLDQIAGIDAWQVQSNPTAVRGIASRVQWDKHYRSFSIRIKVISGGETEFQKRLRAIQSDNDGHLYPHLTIHSYLKKKGGRFLAAAALKTKCLIEKVNFLVDHNNNNSLKPSNDCYGFIANDDGTEFLYMSWDYLIYEGVLSKENVILG